MEHTYVFKEEIEADCINRHFYHSINVQAICQPGGTFSDVLARFPGSFTIQEFGRFQVLGCIREEFQTPSIDAIHSH